MQKRSRPTSTNGHHDELARAIQLICMRTPSPQELDGLDPLTPLEHQVVQLRRAVPAHVILMVACGYRVKVYGRDSRVLSRRSGIMCINAKPFEYSSVPYTHVDLYVHRLVAMGYHVCFADQESAAARVVSGVKSGVFSRGLSQIYSRGTLLPSERVETNGSNQAAAGGTSRDNNDHGNSPKSSGRADVRPSQEDSMKREHRGVGAAACQDEMEECEAAKDGPMSWNGPSGSTHSNDPSSELFICCLALPQLADSCSQHSTAFVLYAVLISFVTRRREWYAIYSTLMLEDVLRRFGIVEVVIFVPPARCPLQTVNTHPAAEESNSTACNDSSAKLMHENPMRPTYTGAGLFQRSSSSSVARVGEANVVCEQMRDSVRVHGTGLFLHALPSDCATVLRQTLSLHYGPTAHGEEDHACVSVNGYVYTSSAQTIDDAIADYLASYQLRRMYGDMAAESAYGAVPQRVSSHTERRAEEDERAGPLNSCTPSPVADVVVVADCVTGAEAGLKPARHKETHAAMSHVSGMTDEEAMILPGSTLRALDVFQSASADMCHAVSIQDSEEEEATCSSGGGSCGVGGGTDSNRHTLLGLLDHTVTECGARTLRAWVAAPLTSRARIIERQEGVMYLAGMSKHPVHDSHRMEERGIGSTKNSGKSHLSMVCWATSRSSCADSKLRCGMDSILRESSRCGDVEAALCKLYARRCTVLEFGRLLRLIRFVHDTACELMDMTECAQDFLPGKETSHGTRSGAGGTSVATGESCEVGQRSETDRPCGSVCGGEEGGSTNALPAVLQEIIRVMSSSAVHDCLTECAVEVTMTAITPLEWVYQTRHMQQPQQQQQQQQHTDAYTLPQRKMRDGLGRCVLADDVHVGGSESKANCIHDRGSGDDVQAADKPSSCCTDDAGVEDELQRHMHACAVATAALDAELCAIRELLHLPGLTYRTIAGTPFVIDLLTSQAKRVPASWAMLTRTKTNVRYHTPAIVTHNTALCAAKEKLAAAATRAWRERQDALTRSTRVHMPHVPKIGSSRENAHARRDAANGSDACVLRRVIAAVAALDALHSLSVVSRRPNYVLPIVFDLPNTPCEATSCTAAEAAAAAAAEKAVEETHLTLRVCEARHPMLDVLLNGSYVCCSVQLRAGGGAWVLTGPNMGGKSALMRMVGLLCIMAQVGCCVPAQSAELPIFAAIHARMGASDSVLEGSSTFMTEMQETSRILRTPQLPRALVLMDELGRGTSSFDGAAVAMATLEYLVSHRATVLFVTHYSYLCDRYMANTRGVMSAPAQSLAAVECYFMGFRTSDEIGATPTNAAETSALLARKVGRDGVSHDDHNKKDAKAEGCDNTDGGNVAGRDKSSISDEATEERAGMIGRGSRIVFTYQPCRGVTPSSFGIEIAKLAGLPERVTVEAATMSRQAEHTHALRTAKADLRRFIQS